MRKVGGDAAVDFAQDLLADPVEAQAKAARGRALIDREYSPARFAEKVGRAYAAVAAAR